MGFVGLFGLGVVVNCIVSLYGVVIVAFRGLWVGLIVVDLCVCDFVLGLGCYG